MLLNNEASNFDTIFYTRYSNAQCKLILSTILQNFKALGHFVKHWQKETNMTENA